MPREYNYRPNIKGGAAKSGSATSVYLFKERLKTMPIEEVRELARVGNLVAKAELFKRTGIQTVVTSQMRHEAIKRDREEKQKRMEEKMKKKNPEGRFSG
jgi:hypothetical protein